MRAASLFFVAAYLAMAVAILINGDGSVAFFGVIICANVHLASFAVLSSIREKR